MTEALAFWGVAVVIGALALPLAFRLFARFPDAGAGLTFSLGLTLVAAGYFLLRVVGVLPAGRGGLLFAIALLALAAVLLALLDRRFLPTLLRSLRGVAVAVGLFSVLFFGYAAFRAYTPDIAHTEQPMDFLYLNAMLVSPDYPPHDPWFAGESASYHYGGYLQAAVLTGASDVWPATGYNLSLAAVLAGAGAAAFSLGAALARWLFGRRARHAATLAASTVMLLLLFAGPLAGAFELASAHGAAHQGVYDAFGVEGLVRCGPDAGEACTGLRRDLTDAWYADDFWPWWRMSRMDMWGPRPAEVTTITEVPAFSFILGDLHPHVMAIPGILLALALCAAVWRGRGRLSWREYRRRPWLLPVIALVFGSLAFVNVWDVVVFSPVLALAVFARNRRTRPTGAAFADAVSWLAPPAVLSVLVFIPWWLDFTPESGGIYAYSGRGTRIEHVLLMWGVLVLPVLPLLGLALKRRRSSLPLLVPFVLAVLPLLIWLPFAAFERTAAASGVADGLPTALGARTGGAWITLAFYGAAIWLLATGTVLLHRRRHPAAPVTALATLGILLLSLTELFLLRDILFSLPRLNTVFKLSYQAWIVLSLAGGIGVVAAVRNASPGLPRLGTAALVVLLGASLVFVITSIPNRAGGFETMAGLDGLRHLKRDAPGEYELVRWLNENVHPTEVVVESSGRTWERDDGGRPVLRRGASSYDSSASRVGYRTGLQTPIGWPSHELTWRGASPPVRDEVSRRQDLVDLVYTAPAPAEVLGALEQLGAEYVVVGRFERSRYRDGLMPPFADFLQVVFFEGDVTVYRVPRYEVVDLR